MRQRYSFPLLILLGLFASSAVWANAISPGQTGITPDPFPSLGSTATVIAESSVFDYSFDGGLTTGEYREYVATDTANPYCSGCLDFGFMFNVTDPNNFIESVSLASFAGLETDGGFFNDSSDEIDPTSMARTSGQGAGVSFTFAPGILPGEASGVVVVETNATSYDANGLAELFDDNGAHLSVANYEPIATPEPSTLLVTGLCLLGVIWRQSRQLKP